MNIGILRKLSIVEGTTLILLFFIALPLKKIWGYPEMVSIIGPIHGVAFIVYVVYLFLLSSKSKLSYTNALIGFVLSFIPFGSFVFERKILPRKSLHL